MAQHALERRALLSVGITKFRLDGHTDNYGEDSYNDQLSLRRADAVADLLASVGIPRANIETRGMGKRDPVADNRTSSGRADAARRVVATRRIEPRAHCERGAGDCIELARVQWLKLPAPTSIPPEASPFWAGGKLVEPFAPEILLLRLRDVEVAPGDFCVLAEGRYALIDGLVKMTSVSRPSCARSKAAMTWPTQASS